MTQAEIRKIPAFMGATAMLMAIGGWVEAANAFTVHSTSAYFDNVLLKNGTLVGSEGATPDAYNKVEFLEDVDGTGENQVRWGSPVYGTEVTTEVWEEGYWDWQDGYWDWQDGYWDWQDGYWQDGYTTTTKVSSWSVNSYLANNPNAELGSCAWWGYYSCKKYNVIETVEGHWVDGEYEWVDGQYDWVDGHYDWVDGEWVETTETVFTSENKSGLGFAGVESLAIAAGEAFNIGTLKHFNETIWGDNLAGIKSGFELMLDFGSGIGQQAFNFDLNIDETNNDASSYASGVCPYQTDDGKGCSDEITWEFTLAEKQTFSHDGKEYTLELVGFSPDELDAANIMNQFISQEDGTSEASLWAKIVEIKQPELKDPKNAASVPEPTALVGLTLLGAYVIRSRRQVNLA